MLVLAEYHEATMRTNGERSRVLVVDDYPDSREMYAEYLETRGYDVVQASNGIEALKQAVDGRPDIILMDLSLPIMDGWEATRRLKADERTAHIPIVALTGHALIAEEVRKVGCDGFVTKPCLPEDLVQKIRQVLDGPGPSGKARPTGTPAKRMG
jgi:two-component system cell cycle response regulator DivK